MEYIVNTLPDGTSVSQWVSDLPTEPESIEEVRKRAFDELREARAPMLNAVSGIMGDAIFRGDVEMAEEAAAIRQKLLDVTKDPLLLSATTYADMKLAGQYAYRKIANAASSGFKSVFKETTGA